MTNTLPDHPTLRSHSVICAVYRSQLCTCGLALVELEEKRDRLVTQLAHTDARNARIRLQQDIDDLDRQIRLLKEKSNAAK